MNRRTAIAALAATSMFAHSRKVTAGGMAVVYLVGDLPIIRAGVPFNLRFAVLGHDMIDHLWNGFDCELSLAPHNGGEILTHLVPGRGNDALNVGAYSTEPTIPSAGTYKWSIRPGSWEPTYFPTLHVVDSESVSTTPTASGNDVVRITAQGPIPHHVVVSPGSTVRWLNVDEFSSHQIVWRDLNPDLGDSSPIRPGGVFETRLDALGDYEYHCGPNQESGGVVSVSDA